MIPGAASATAVLVAASVARCGAGHGLPGPAIEFAERALAKAARRGSIIARLSRHRAGRWLLAFVLRLVLPGLPEHHCARKAWIWHRLTAATSMPVRFAWLGVGLDALGRALMHARPGSQVIETDHPDTLRLRREAGADPRIDMHPLELPATDRELRALCGDGPTTLVCEGVAMYLRPRQALRLLRRVAGLPAPPRLVFSALEPCDEGGRGFRRRSRLVQGWLARRGEPFQWRCDAARLRRCLASHGYTVDAFWPGDGFGEYVIDAVPRSG